MSVEGPIKLRPEHWGPPGIVLLDYVSPDGGFWNVSRIMGAYVQLWTIDAWGTVKPDIVREAEFRKKWSENNHHDEGVIKSDKQFLDFVRRTHEQERKDGKRK